MIRMILAFFSLYLATLLLLVGSGLFNTYVGVYLTSLSVSEIWVGALMAVYYLGLVLGARTGHKLIIKVGHIRAYAASAAVVTVTVLLQVLISELWVWLLFRFVAGMAMVTMLMVLESWLNEQTENHQRGKVFAFYMVFSGLGTVLGQLTLPLFGQMEYEPLVFVGICSALCLIPIALTGRLHPALQVPAPLNVRYYLNRVPVSLTVLFIAGMITGAFYGLAPVFIVRQEVSSEQVALFLASAVAAGLVSQWPMGWLADRVNRADMIRINAVILTLLAIPLWGWWSAPFWALIALACMLGVLQFTLYPLGAAFANDNVDPDRRVGLSAILLMVYGLGACIGPLLAGMLMQQFNPNALYIFTSLCAGVLAVFVRTQHISGDHLSQDAPTSFVPMPDTLQSSPIASVLDPRVDMEHDVSHEPVPEELLAPDGDAGSQEPEEHPPAGEGEDPSAGNQQQDGADGQGDAQRVHPG
ncbi:MFS transporter [Paracandidimonas soli]|uniref:Putative MFS family arabinose efflux permease n=1 Tax=Paracandidimonas soli TaxID=1917182 RepID=A0A4R3VCM8_9BURK|nr:putative MFS family arabinose efflux permease [Paracandidimonas soli]